MTIETDQRGMCPHCKTPNRFEGVQYIERRAGKSERILDFPYFELIDGLEDEIDLLSSCRCTQCGKIILFLEKQMIYPIGAPRTSAPKEVPEKIATDFNEACLVEPLSKKASAALARRCLQNMLHDQNISKDNLSEEIDEAMTRLPTHLSEAIDAIRNIGNFAAHPIKSEDTGKIIDVEDGETEWILDVIEQLFDFYYVQPAATRAKRGALNEKLNSAGKPPVK